MSWQPKTRDKKQGMDARKSLERNTFNFPLPTKDSLEEYQMNFVVTCPLLRGARHSVLVEWH